MYILYENHKNVFDELSNNEINQIISNFVEKLDYNYIIKNRNANLEKVKENHALAKKAEIILNYLLNQNLDIDFEIRQDKKKGWVPDLVVNGENIHVKTCDKNTLAQSDLKPLRHGLNRFSPHLIRIGGNGLSTTPISLITISPTMRFAIDFAYVLGSFITLLENHSGC
jgi:hypothetical protein